MKTYRRILILMISISVTRCQNILKRFNDVVWHDKSDNYAITNNMTDSCNNLYLITRDQSYMRLRCISRIGDGDHFIIAETGSANKGLQYWIIDKDRDRIDLPADQVTEGPYNLTDFTKRENELGIQNLIFQKLKE